MEARFIWLLLFCLFGVQRILAISECGEFHKNEFIRGKLAEFDKELAYEDELNQLLDAFNENDTQRMDDLLELLEEFKTIDENERIFNFADQMRPVVSLIKTIKFNSYKKNLNLFFFLKNSPT